ncbi:MAG: hypothetical protein GTN36_04725 [Candidatus Aenigmarchaeota archaeon]|nr:hypothetical protein [Candidatus Aenigmarchaeota archaeon]
MVRLRDLEKAERRKEEVRRRDNVLNYLEESRGKSTVYDAASRLARAFETEIGFLYVDENSIVVESESGERFISDFNSAVFRRETKLDSLMKGYQRQGLMPLTCMKVGGSCPKQPYKDYRGQIVVKELNVSDGICGKLDRPIRRCDDLERGLILHVKS